MAIYDAVGNIKIPMFRLNDTTSGTQFITNIAVNAIGSFAVVWRDSARQGIYARSYSSNGTPLTGEQLVISDADKGFASASDLVIDQQGAFIVALSVNTASGLRDSYVRRFSSTGFAVGPALKINTSSGDHIAAHMATSASGFVVTWLNSIGSPLMSSAGRSAAAAALAQPDAMSALSRDDDEIRPWARGVPEAEQAI